jgi:N-terminal domain on NACHT_NTPase and P-loop NTPases/NB-ARC domain
MAEAFAVIGIVASIAQLVDYGLKIIKRLDEFSSATTDLPESFRSVRVRLALIIETFQRVQAQAEADRISETTANVLKPVVESSLDHTQELTKILDKAIPTGTYSTFDRRLQAVKSLAYDRKVQKIVDQLHSDIQILNFHQTTSHLDISDQIRLELSRLTLVPTSPTPNYTFGLNLGGAPQIVDGLFVGRDAELRQLQQWLMPQPSTQNVVAVSAMGGLGKTQLSLAFAKHNQATYSSVFWLNAKDEATLKQDYVALSRQLFNQTTAINLSSREEEDRAVQQVRKWLSQDGNDQWLIIFDNHDDPKISGVASATAYNIRQFFPHRSQGSILITTRSRRLTFAKQLKLRELADEGESVAILSKRSSRDLTSGQSSHVTNNLVLDGLGTNSMISRF